MRDLQKIYQECVQECRDANIPIQHNRVVKVKFTDYNSERFWGFCTPDKKRRIFSIFINSELSQESCPIEELKEDIIHELLHTCPRCLSHGKTWMKYARVMDERYGYELTTSKDYNAVFHKEKPILHRFACPGCGSFFNLRTEWEDCPDPYYIRCDFCNRFLYKEIGRSGSRKE